ncbi:MAG: adenylate/guanylate cyclase domain-containing protein [Candidatus Wallbacteria bacterium]|nr:adenylate/guanylate cyclase domain-containing protein [Candidatus Wallbacteria bacterium]
MESAVRQFTKYTLRKSRTGKMALIKAASQDVGDADSENLRFLQLVLESEKDLQLREMVKKALNNKASRQSAETGVTLDSVPRKMTSYQISKSRYLDQTAPAFLEREMKKRIRDNADDPFFSNAPSCGFLRKDLVELIKRILPSPPLWAFFIPGLPCEDGSGLIYADLLILSNRIRPQKKHFTDNGLCEALSSMVPDLYYIIVLSGTDGLYFFTRGGLEWTHTYHCRIGYGEIAECHVKGRDCMVRLNNGEVLPFVGLDTGVSDEIEIAVQLGRVLQSGTDFDKMTREKDKLSILLKARIISRSNYEQRLKRITSVLEKILSGDKLEQLLTSLAHGGRVSGRASDFLIRECGRELCILFSDIVGYSAKCRELGTVSVMGLLSIYERIGGEIAASCNGTLLKKIGDGLLFTFDDPLQALHAARMMLEKISSENTRLEPELRFQVRTVLTKGTVFVKKGDVFGDSVNIVSRIEKEANAGEIVATEEFIRAIPDRSGFRDIGEREIRGFDGTVRLFKTDAHPSDEA